MDDDKKQQSGMRRVNSRLKILLQEKSDEKKSGKKKACGERDFAACLRELPVLPRQKEVEDAYIFEVMRRTGDSQVKAAEIMGITPQALCSRLKKYREKK